MKQDNVLELRPQCAVSTGEREFRTITAVGTRPRLSMAAVQSDATHARADWLVAKAALFCCCWLIDWLREESAPNQPASIRPTTVGTFTHTHTPAPTGLMHNADTSNSLHMEIINIFIGSDFLLFWITSLWKEKFDLVLLLKRSSLCSKYKSVA